jgi:hypothetical protein
MEDIITNENKGPGYSLIIKEIIESLIKMNSHYQDYKETDRFKNVYQFINRLLPSRSYKSWKEVYLTGFEQIPSHERLILDELFIKQYCSSNQSRIWKSIYQSKDPNYEELIQTLKTKYQNDLGMYFTLMNKFSDFLCQSELIDKIKSLEE